ncbi:hypothetical protein PHJA_001938400 [Phtheirospermum japonicum]|uniref:Uncharacterized protein n=1 Tax=Phtheirospermum japonicum TaxID=374723 RepID=A0A830CQ14_9LAMI|nr:hypothetical protein PHJA_001938400 [Phtheirospermum japonicum]
MFFRLDLQQFERLGEARKIIDDKILPHIWYISPHKRRELISTVLRKTLEAVVGSGPSDFCMGGLSRQEARLGDSALDGGGVDPYGSG